MVIKMKAKTKKIITIVSIILIVLLLLLFIKVPVSTIGTTNTTSGSLSGSGGSSGSSGGSSGASTPAKTDTPLLFVPFSWFDFTAPVIPSVPSYTVPCLFNCGDSDLISNDRITPVVECSRNSDCNKCANPDYDTCSDSVCICAKPEETSLWTDIRTTFTEPECTRNSNCNKCANPVYDTCTNGVCGCVAPSIVEDVRTTLVPECSRDTECNKCANPVYDKCVSGSCSCVAPTIVSCTDTDTRSGDGVNYKVQGECTGKTLYGNDFCNGSDQLVEFSCGSDDCSGKTISCSTTFGRGYFCKDGACVTLV
jgi:hypothetical protein